MEGTNAYIPVLPLWLSIVLLIFNCVVPGSGMEELIKKRENTFQRSVYL